MANNLQVLITTNKNNLVAFAAQQGGPSAWFYRKLETLIGQLGLGAFNSNIQVIPNLVAASGTVTFSSIVATDTVTIGATVFTGSNSSSGTAQFRTGGTDTAAATSLAAVINANTTTNKLVIATSALAVVTVTCLNPGLLGNFFPIAISAHGSVSGSGKLTSGTQGTIASYVHGL